MKKFLELKFYKTIDCSSAVAFWNYWDHEHLEIVHSTSYSNVNILYEKNDLVYSIRDISLPFINLKVSTPIFMKQINKNELIAFSIQLGVLSKTKVKIIDLTKDKCEIFITYKFYLNGWKNILRPILKILVPIWNKKVWKEDLSIKLRRQKVLRYNFKDFIGLPKKIKDRFNDEIIELKLPIPRPKNSLSPKIEENENK